MPDATRVCKICGVTYPYCRTKRSVDGVFRWQDVACCPEHGSEYLAEILKSRGEAVASAPDASCSATEAAPKKTVRTRRTTPIADDSNKV